MLSLPQEVVTLVIAIQVAVVLWNMFLCLFAFYRFFYNNKDKIKFEISTVCTCAMISHAVTSIANLVGVFDFAQCPSLDISCSGHSIIFIVSCIITIAGQLINLCLIYYLMAIRVTSLLKDSIFQLSKRMTIYFKVFIIIEAVISIGCVTFVAMYKWDTRNKEDGWIVGNYSIFLQLFGGLFVLCVLFYIINFIFVINVFSGKIKELSKELFGNNIKSQRILYELIIRTVVCCGIAITSTICTGMGIVAACCNITKYLGTWNAIFDD